MSEVRSPADRFDLLFASLVFAAVAIYLCWLPWSLGAADESFFLYEAKRIREGEVMYRDFFQFVAPGAWHFQALLFWIFGTSMATARISTGVLHGAIVVVLYASARRLGMRREIAAVVLLAYMALCQPAWPIAGPHWYATFLVCLLLLVALDGAWAGKARASFPLGVLAGVLIMVQQQKGVITAGGIAALLVADAWLGRLLAIRPAPRTFERLFWLAAGVSVVVGPSLLAMVAAAGFRPVFDDLVLYPLREYRGATGAHWGGIGPISRGHAAYTWPSLLRVLPLAAVPAALRLAFGLIRVLMPAPAAGTPNVAGAAPPVAVADGRRLLVLIVFLLTGVLSILYNPDFIHIAFIAPLAFLLAGETIEWGLRRMRPRALARAAGWIAAVGVAAVLARQVADNTVRRRAQYPISHQTAFGRVDFGQPWEPLLVDRLRAALDTTTSRELFCYPFASAPYLTAGGRNPTPFQHLAPSQSPAWQVEQAVSIVRERQVPYIVVAPVFLTPKDPIGQLIGERYEFVPLGDTPESLPKLWLYARRDLAAAATPPKEVP